MLLQLRDYIQREGRVSLQQLVRAFQIDENALLPMLNVWVQKGILSSQEHGKGCFSACGQCPKTKVVFYESQN